MKRIASMILSAALMLTLAVPAAAAAEAPAASSTDQRLAQVTAKVKKTLGIGDEYEEFYGELSENEISPVWDLNWSREGERLSVTASESGKVLSYYLSEDGEYSTPSSGGGFAPAFPVVSREQAQQSAEAFLKKVLDSSLETAVFSDRNTGRLDTSSHRFNGSLRLNGLPSPLTFSMTVRASDGKVTHFYRESLERDTLGGVPSAKAATGQGAAGALLKQTVKLRLEYVRDEDSEKAVLRYLQEPAHSYLVDGQTGKLVDLTELYEKIESGSDAGSAGGYLMNGLSAAPEATADSNAASLSQAELSGISKMEGVLSKEELDKKLRAISALGLDKYTLGSASYSLDKETGDVTAWIVYSFKDGDGTWRRRVSCDGKTGELLRVYSSAPYSKDRKALVSEDAARKTAEAFLTGLWGGEFAKTELYGSTAWDGERWSNAHSFVYAQKENGYFFPENSLRIAVDISDGSISELDRAWTEDVVFDSTEGILDEAAALDAWFAHYSVALAYRSVPVKLDTGMDGAAPLLEKGYSYFYSLKLSYALEEDRPASGLDAKSGKAVYRDTQSENGSLVYSDMEDHWARSQIETLARYGIGWLGGTCQPRKELTQLDLVALLASANGYRYDPEEDDAGELYSRAYGLGILTRTERQDGKLMTRGETVQMLLGSAGYGHIARLPGIFTCSFADRAEIPAGLLGWAALAQGLGVVDGGSSFAAGRTATRAEAAIMLYNFMNRTAA